MKLSEFEQEVRRRIAALRVRYAVCKLMEKQAPGISAVEAAVERITASRTFARAGRADNLLRYVVERTAAGRPGRYQGVHHCG